MPPSAPCPEKEFHHGKACEKPQRAANIRITMEERCPSTKPVHQRMLDQTSRTRTDQSTQKCKKHKRYSDGIPESLKNRLAVGILLRRKRHARKHKEQRHMKIEYDAEQRRIIVHEMSEEYKQYAVSLCGIYNWISIVGFSFALTHGRNYFRLNPSPSARVVK